MAGPPPSQECSAEKMEHAIIDINLSLARGIRGAEPVYAPGPEACVRTCCSGGKLSGKLSDKKCNLMIFDARRTSTHPNCYLFYCPSTEACPMKPATGFVSYKITRDTYTLEDTSIKTEDFSLNGHSLSSDAGTFISHSQTSHQNHTAALQQSVFHQAPELLNHMANHLGNSEFHTVFPESQRAKHPESLDAIPSQKVMNLPSNMSSAVQIENPSAVTPLPTSSTRLESRTTSLRTGGAKPTAVTTTTTAAFPPTVNTRAKPGIPATTIAVTHVPLSSPTTSASTSTTNGVTTNSRSATAPSELRTPAIPPEPTIVSSNDTSHVTLPSSSGFALSTSVSPTASQSDPQGYDPSDSESYLPESVLRGKGVVQLGEKSSLVAALLFGVIFLLLVIALTGKKIHESLQKRRYTRLDYLINGMYADV
ncbi:PREDICTED: MANSC domain-containing protein 1 [Chlamydotis macqueenii]|uniref:MANSC domain-containing protein 1 n=1 Tax=Chlamydotis macqueenii TaxID=187382 RepID=UPI0005299D98|nr:PREDICTED: MANSC domain-containing protein 1 [Chlamydotis macqueenii]